MQLEWIVGNHYRGKYILPLFKIMSPEKQRIAIAEACGWKFVNYGPQEYPTLYWRLTNPIGHQIANGHTDKVFMSLLVPNYLTDLNAIHKAQEQVLCAYPKPGEFQSTKYIFKRHLRIICEDPFFATADQRAEALLKAIGKLEESS